MQTGMVINRLNNSASCGKNQLFIGPKIRWACGIRLV